MSPTDFYGPSKGRPTVHVVRKAFDGKVVASFDIDVEEIDRLHEHVHRDDPKPEPVRRDGRTVCYVCAREMPTPKHDVCLECRRAVLPEYDDDEDPTERDRGHEWETKMGGDA